MSANRLCLLILLLAPAPVLFAQSQAGSAFREGQKVFIAEMPDGFDNYLKEALRAKAVPLVVVDSRSDADLEITGTSETHKAGKAKKILRLNWHSAEQASIAITNLQSGEVVFAYSVNKESSAHGKKSTAEACAKHIKKALKKNR